MTNRQASWPVGHGRPSSWFDQNMVWGDVPTWVAAVGTVAAVAFALRAQVRDRRAQVLRERRRQAEQVTAWHGIDPNTPSGEAAFVLSNASDSPVYQVVVTSVPSEGTGEGLPENTRRMYVNLPPGRAVVHAEFDGGMHRRPAVEIAFTDATGNVHWVRRTTGELVEVEKSAPEHYDMTLPGSWRMVKRTD